MAARMRWAALAFMLLVFALLAAQVVLHGPLTGIDEHVTTVLAAHRQPGVTRAMLLVTTVNETGVLLAIALLLAAWRVRRRDARGALVLAAVPLGELLNIGLKNVLQRPRPALADPLVHLATYSFPSGHAVASTVFYGALCVLVFRHTRSGVARAAAVAIAVAMVLLVCFSRVYLGAHYLSDVLAGIAVGGACLALMLRPAAVR